MFHLDIQIIIFVLSDLRTKSVEGQQSTRAGPSVQTANPSTGLGVYQFRHFLCQINALHPDMIHPQRDWIDQNLRDASPVVRGKLRS